MALKVEFIPGRTGFRYVNVSDEEAFEQVLANRPCPVDDGRHKWCFDAARICKDCRIEPAAAVTLIRSNLTRPEQHPREVEHAVSQAYRTDVESTGRSSVKADPFDPAKLAEVAARLPFKMTSKWLMERSPVKVDGVTPGGYLDLIHPGRKAMVLNRYRSRRGFIYEGSHEDRDMTAFANGNRPDERGKAGAWFIANAVDGEGHVIEKDEKGRDIYSYRSEKSLTTWNYCVLESDVAPADQWCAMLVQEPLAVVSLVWTGNDSVHALIRIRARNKSEFNEEKNKLITRYSSLGADDAAIRAVQLTRLPGIRRSDNGKVQRLLWFTPGAIARPIWNQEKTACRVTNPAGGNTMQSQNPERQ